jgi:calcium-dependent protein kinase
MSDTSPNSNYGRPLDKKKPGKNNQKVTHRQKLEEPLSSSSSLFREDFTSKFEVEDVNQHYNIGKEIGSGKYGVVRLCQRKSYERKRFALKSISRQKIYADLIQLQQEFEILKSVDHPNIITFYELFVDDNFVHFVTEFCGGGELFEHIISRGRFSEAYASKIIKQVLSAIKHLHDKNICHRDLKPENILFETKSKDS